MPRIRTIKPSFFQSEDVSDLPLRARLTWLGLWTQCDDHGRTKDNVKLIKANVWALDDVSLKDVESDLNTLADRRRIVRYEADGASYLAVTNWHHHQSINRGKAARFPPPPEPVGVPAPNTDGHCPECWVVEDALMNHGFVSDGSPQEGKGREGKGGDARARPCERCDKHRTVPDPPNCRACKRAREAAEAWDVEHRLDATMTVRACSHCDAEGYRYEPGSRRPMTPYVRCDHQEPS